MTNKSKDETTTNETGKNRVKVLDLKRETIKDLTGSQSKEIKGGGGCPSSVLGDRRLTNE